MLGGCVCVSVWVGLFVLRHDLKVLETEGGVKPSPPPPHPAPFFSLHFTKVF